ncbi:hypothetical protein [Microbispora siamensis]|uniref:Uncharacterized protein n=1 Tax=Microbispora siamensis TaxID=564413 RepID=A0ABQ4H0B2_9ACTN|nr:hypothetical protein [Microbispora siamensis]GIH67122.1 hypothetical protein Msi02_79390 [Microbispora siamensis]
MSGLAGVVLACYPPWFRERYGEELAALVEETDGGPRVTLDLALGAARAWLRPALAGDSAARVRRRMQATLATTWVAWCAGISSVPMLDRLLLDPPPPGTPHVVGVLMSVSWVLVLAGCLVAVAAALLLTLSVLVPARDGRLVAPLLPGGVLAGVEAVGGLMLAQPHRHSAGFLAGVLAWVGGLALTGLAAAAGPVVTLCRARPSAVAMRRPVRLAVAVTAVLGAVALVDGVAAAMADRTALTLSVVAACGVAALCSSISVVRTLPLL